MLEQIKTQFNRLGNKNQRIFLFAFASFVLNITYGIGNAIVGFMTFSWWFITLTAYYVILSIMRLALVLSEKQSKTQNTEKEVFAKRFSGVMLICLSVVLIGTVILTIKQDIGTKFHEVVMITIATYTFTKLVFAIINLCKSKKVNVPIIKALRNISLADAAVSIFSLQRSMLSSFAGMEIADIRLFNALTGTAVCIIVLILGINLLRKETKKWLNQK